LIAAAELRTVGRVMALKHLSLVLIGSLFIVSCDEKKPAGPNAAASSAPAVASTAPPVASSAAPAASAPPRSDCPKGSAGPGTFDQPCDQKGSTRLMEIAWTGKTDDKGPHFKVTNKSSSVILYGRVAAYFYDKAGKQLEVKDASGKGHPSHGCGGNIFGGVMKPKENAVITFSCVKKETVPEGTAAIEAEIPMVGFASADEKKSEFYWRNEDLVPEQRKKGGVK
jgi:hypothetical protein